MTYVSRAGGKLAHALQVFNVDPEGMVCADFGANTGGFTDCLLQNGAQKVYAVETGYGVLAWKLRQDERVVTMERTNAMHVKLPEHVDLVVSDTSWTPIVKILPNILKSLREGGRCIVLIKPQYEASPEMIRKGKLPDAEIPNVLAVVRAHIENANAKIIAETESPITGGKAGNTEFLFLLQF